MTTLDIVLIILLALTTFSGLRKGLIRSLGGIIALILGAYIAGNFYLNFHAWVSQWISINEAAGKIIAFILLFLIATKAIALVFYLIEKAFNMLAIIPGSKYINNLLGALFGLLEGALFLGLIFHVSAQYNVFFSGPLLNALGDSVVIPYLQLVINFMLPILPQALTALEGLV